MEASVRELLAAAQAERKVKLDAGRVDTVFTVGNWVLLRTAKLLHASDMGKQRPRWHGPFTMTAYPSTNAYIFALPRKMRAGRRSTPTCSSPSSRVPGRRRLPGQCPKWTLDRRANTGWSCC